ncbi:RluA family pseudouridine synthase [Convivina intestini]|uniref:Pseudouridine synthase n=1 Tax=Convivina intestini TaxID=1505726 RepID=A0A2U1DCJ1_9LACO|nr:RluA family pseudouridine synthase [Convivina intestini]PVY85299.1 RluA family pseudouridine synthase [Convivina intestini]CAH1850341.1 Ribosomal large subunit pseudouridine synthase D [Convivina intestini]CAH1852789.1 Ribosomal large subunit pseudouridine synthase D [Convivina intestini]SDB86572.1 23S rRNA pseudouridine1911/1915/1917 synthase [Leuconostocaceae bacterium R-53105]
MEFTWTYQGDEQRKVRTFLQGHGVSHRMFSQMKHNGGAILANGQPVYTADYIKNGDQVTIVMPIEESNDLVVPDFHPLDIIFENEHWLVVDKPYGVTTVPGHADRLHTLVNQVKGHLIDEKAEDLVPHVVTRLDRDTSGLVLLAKHRFAHAVLDQQLQDHSVEKFYIAYVQGILPEDHGLIDEPIGRMDGDFIKRIVREDGKVSKTEYWVERRYQDDPDHPMTRVKVQLHTGRTHQIRVHFAHLGYPLVGDDLYGGPLWFGLKRQALHAYQMKFYDPFIEENRQLSTDLPADLLALKNL